MSEKPYLRQALLWERAGEAVRCLTCERRCALVDGQSGWCGTRANHQGTLYTLTFGSISSLSANPIEKKPLYHFYPGTIALTVGSWSCNFGCPWCQNWSISKASTPERGDALSPERFVALAVERGCQGTCISFNEPTLSLEWSLEAFRLARQRGLYNTFVTNGYMTEEALALLIEAGLEAMNVDLKGDAQAVRQYGQGIDVEKVWRNCRLARQRGVHLEIATLVIPGVNDADEVLRGIAQRIAGDLGTDVPWHVTGYYPAYRFTAPPTTVRALERAWQVGREAGLAFVYVGNVPDHRFGHTYCPGCEALLVRRSGLDVLMNALRNGHCPACGRPVNGVWTKQCQNRLGGVSDECSLDHGPSR